MAEILHQIRIAASPERVFEMITTSAGFAVWWTEDSSVEPTAGTVATFRFLGGKVTFRMRIDEFDSPHRVTWTCLGDYEEWNGTTLAWNLSPTESGGTVLDLAHRGWEKTDGEYPQCNASWGHLLHLMKDHLEGKTVSVHPAGRSES